MRIGILPLERGRCQASPGQFFLAIPPSFDPYLPRVVWPFQIQGRAVESLAVPSPVEDWERAGMLRLRGPYGRPFELPPKAGNALVICADEPALTQLTGLIAALVNRENEVVVVSPTVDWADRTLPVEVEHRTHDEPLAGAVDLFNWADAVFACGTSSFYDRVYRTARGTRTRLYSGRAQILLRDLPVPCGVGLCHLCACPTRRGTLLTCREGPVLDLALWLDED